MINELDIVALTKDFPDDHLTAGDVGAVVLVHENGKGFEVEFVATDGTTLAMKTLLPNDIRKTTEAKEIFHVRKVA